MAAYAALVSVMQILDQIQVSSPPPISIDKSQLQSLTQKLAFLQEFLEGYSSHVGYTEEADPMECRIADAAYAAEDVIESYIVDQILARSTNHDEEISSIEFYQSLQTVIEKMELIEVEIEEKKGARDQLHTIKSATHAGSSVRAAPEAPITVGFDDVLLQMLDKIIGGRPDRQIIPIVGMGGIGKTTLARNIYVNTLVKEHFDVCAWSTISQEHNSLEILKQVLAQVKKGDWEHLSESHELGEQLYKHLIGRRYIIVMDDMWSIDAWDGVRRFFPDNRDGSRIIVTTRLSNLASKFDDGLKMKFLDEASGWSLFSKTVFGEGTCPLELEDTGKRIVEGCRGLPLSIAVIGALLSKSKQTRENWESIEKDLNSIVNMEDNERCLQILYLSYNSLPVHLKPCFLYMSIYGEDENIKVSTLVALWAAEGFLKPLVGKSLEEAAEEYLEELIDRNLIIVEKRNYCRKLRSFKIHDLLRDLCLREAQKVKFLCVLKKGSIPRDLNTQRRIKSMLSKYPTEVLQSLGNASLVRSVFGYFPKTLLSKFRMLRIPLLKNITKSGEYCEEVSLRLVNLRYIVFRGKDPFPWEIPSSTSFFWNFQTLLLDGRDDCIDFKIWKLPQLRHVMTIDEVELCLPCPTDAEDTVVLRNLHTLSTVTNLICGEEVVCRMPNIKKLKLSYDGSMEASPGLNNLRHLHKLETLTIDIDASPGLNNLRHLHKLETLTIDIDASCDFPCRLVHNISFPHSLKWLTLERTELQWEDVNTKIGSLPLLQVLKLGMYAVIGFKWKTLEGQFRSLKFLRISRLCDLEKWETDNTHFPRLQHLVLRYMIRLREIPLSMGDIPTLRLIELKCCIAAEDSAKRILEEQEELGNADLEVFITNLKGLDFRTGSFTLRQIKAATNNFDPANKIEEGGFGPVYKGVSLDGQVIAVKQLSSKSKQGNREFINEIDMISALQHPHLVKLYGCCIEGNQLLLVHEYCQNNSLARALFGPEAYQLHLDWATRHTICIGIARGLAYLHEESRIKIIHRDINTRNVLLDENLVPKICNFGLAKLDEEDNTTYIAGTFGYMAPEYAMYGYLTDKADVFSFGVVLLEIVSGKEQNFYLIDWANSLKAKGSLLELVDPRLELKFNKEEVTRSINVALLCTNAKAVERPSMSAVVSMLEGRVGVQKFVSDSSISIDKTKPEEISRDGEGQSFSVDVPWSGSSASASAPNLYPVALDTSYWEKRGM